MYNKHTNFAQNLEILEKFSDISPAFVNVYLIKALFESDMCVSCSCNLLDDVIHSISCSMLSDIKGNSCIWCGSFYIEILL